MLVSNIKRVLKIAGFFLCFAFLVFFIDVNCYDSTGFGLENVLYTYSEDPDKYDVITIGSSTMYTMFDPEIVDEKSGISSLNFGSAVQGVDDTYYLLKEIYKHGTPEYVMVGTGTARMTMDDYEYGSSILLYSFPDSFDRLRFFIKEFQVKDLLKYFRTDPAEFHISKLFNGEYIEYFKSHYKDEPVSSLTHANGFIYREKEFDNTPTIPEGFYIADRSEKYLKKIIELCQSKGSNVILLNPPISAVQFRDNQIMDVYNDYFNSIAEEYGVENWDLSFLKKEYIEYTNYNFGDHMHTNGRGGQMYSRVLGMMIKDYIDGDFNHRNYFYRTHAECVTGQNLTE